MPWRIAGLDWNALQALWFAYWPYVATVAGVTTLVVIDRVLMRRRIGRVARRLGARVTRTRGNVWPTLEWRDGVRTAQLGFPRSDGGVALRATVCRVDLAQPVRFAVDVRRRGLLAQAGLWLPARRGEVRTGQAQFDRCFRIRSADAATARRWLDREVRRALVRLARVSGGSAFRCVADGARLIARLGGTVTAPTELRLFAETAVWLTRTLEAAAWGSAVAFATSRTAATPTGSSTSVLGALCPACAEPAAHDTNATCPVCRATHHPACWEWLGGCGVYGCAGAGAAAVRAA